MKAESATPSVDGYFYVEYYSDAHCSLQSTFSNGYALGECMVGYDSTGAPVGSALFSCNQSVLFYDIFFRNDCTFDYDEYNVTLDTGMCFPLPEREAQFGTSYMAYCNNEDALPVHHNSVLVR